MRAWLYITCTPYRRITKEDERHCSDCFIREREGVKLFKLNGEYPIPHIYIFIYIHVYIHTHTLFFINYINYFNLIKYSFYFCNIYVYVRVYVYMYKSNKQKIHCILYMYICILTYWSTS